MKINTVPSNKLPDVKLMNVPDDWNTSQETRLELRGVDVTGGGVEEDVDRLPEQRPGAHTDEDHDHEAEQRVDVVPELPVGEPDHGGADEHYHTSQGVSHHVQEHALIMK